MRPPVLLWAGIVAIVLGGVAIVLSLSATGDAESAVAVADSMHELNESVVDSAPQQQVAAQWHTNDLLGIAITQAAQQSRLTNIGIAVLIIVGGLLTIASAQSIPNGTSVINGDTAAATAISESAENGAAVADSPGVIPEFSETSPESADPRHPLDDER